MKSIAYPLPSINYPPPLYGLSLHFYIAAIILLYVWRSQGDLVQMMSSGCQVKLLNKLILVTLRELS